MASKTLNISEEAYALLHSLKQEHESFTDVILRIGGQRRLSELVGVLSKREADALRRAVAEGRRLSRRRRIIGGDRVAR